MSTPWVTNPEGILEPKIGSTGNAARKALTVIDCLKETVEKHGSRPAMGVKRPVNGVVPADWTMWTWQQYYDDGMKFAKALVTIGCKPFDVVNILGFNSPEWLIANTGSILAGNIAAGIYSTNMAEACHYITEHSKSPVVVLEDNKQLAKYAARPAGSMKSLKAIVIWMEEPKADLVAKCGVPVYTFDAFLKLGADVTTKSVEDRTAAIQPGNCCTLIYTSGTTGPPKAVMCSHDNITWTAGVMISDYFDFNHEERLVSFLPLSHIAAQLIDIHVPLRLGGCTYFANPDAMKGTLTVTMRDVRPTVFFGVPRVWEKIQEKMVQLGRSATGLKATISSYAKSVGKAKTEMNQYGNGGGAPMFYGCVKSVVFSKVKDALGLDQCKCCFTAAAPIAPEVIQYFGSLDIPIYEVFGQSECTGPHTVSCDKEWKIGTCGRPMSGTETKIDPSTGELCYRGRHIFMGYMYMPEKTAETIDADGFLHSGDVATFDDCTKPDIAVGPSGFMRITGRIKELIITAGGENVPPVLIENEMKAAMVALSNCMVVGDKKKFLAMLISVKTEVDLETMLPTNKLAADSLHICKQIGSSATTTEEVAQDPAWKEYFEKGRKEANSKTTSNAQVVQKYVLLPTDFSEKAGDLTPTLKLKRNVVTEKYNSLIESMYGE